jgi:hypothetical protein
MCHILPTIKEKKRKEKKKWFITKIVHLGLIKSGVIMGN